jgi:hypothetical protein
MRGTALNISSARQRTRMAFLRVTMLRMTLAAEALAVLCRDASTCGSLRVLPSGRPLRSRPALRLRRLRRPAAPELLRAPERRGRRADASDGDGGVISRWGCGWDGLGTGVCTGQPRPSKAQRVWRKTPPIYERSGYDTVQCLHCESLCVPSVLHVPFPYPETFPCVGHTIPEICPLCWWITPFDSVLLPPC